MSILNKIVIDISKYYSENLEFPIGVLISNDLYKDIVGNFDESKSNLIKSAKGVYIMETDGINAELDIKNPEISGVKALRTEDVKYNEFYLIPKQ